MTDTSIGRWDRTSVPFALVLGCAATVVACSDGSTNVIQNRPWNLEPEPVTGDPRIAFVSNREGWPYLYVADADGSHVTRLVRGGSRHGRGTDEISLSSEMDTFTRRRSSAPTFGTSDSGMGRHGPAASRSPSSAKTGS